MSYSRNKVTEVSLPCSQVPFVPYTEEIISETAKVAGVITMEDGGKYHCMMSQARMIFISWDCFFCVYVFGQRELM